MLISFAFINIVVLVASKVTTRELKKPILSLTIILPIAITISIFLFLFLSRNIDQNAIYREIILKTTLALCVAVSLITGTKTRVQL